ncbi:hypothetical protein M8J77_011554 [Diaphorina citri]|nr:hypothetical protein M8J77_011554 [Diaphorina citri]
MDDQSLKSLKKSDAIINEDMNRKYLSIEESLKTENSSVNNNVEMWKVELMSKLEREIKLQTTSYIDKFHSVTCKPINSQYCENDCDNEEETNTITTLNKNIKLNLTLVREDPNVTPRKSKSNDQQHVIYLLETKIKQFERELVQVKFELRSKTNAYEEMMSKLNHNENEHDCALVAKTAEELQLLLDAFVNAAAELGLKVNVSKTQVMYVNCPPPVAPITIHTYYPIWKTLNGLRTKVSKCKKNMKKWGLSEDDLCDCGSIQDEAHLLVCPNAAATCNEQDLLLVNDAAIQVAEYWKRSI